MKIFFAIAAALLLFMLLATNDAHERKCLTISYIVTMAGIVAFFMIDWLVVLWN